jgi:hypothetical protein
MFKRRLLYHAKNQIVPVECRVAFVRTGVSEESVASNISVYGISEVGRTVNFASVVSYC